MNSAIRLVLCFYGGVSILAVILYLPKLLGFRFAFRKPLYKRATAKRRISVIIPARNESKIIGDLFASLQKQTYDPACFEINVIIKDENDPTRALAEAIGANVFVVPGQTCKGDALDGYFKALSKEELASFEAFVIVDADALLAPDYLAELNNALEHDYDIYLTRKFAKNYLGDKNHRSVFSNCSALTWPIIDDMGNLYRMQKDMPLNLCGQGMMLRRRVIEELGGWPYRTLTEDYELKVDSLLHGFTSMFYPYAVIYTEEALRHKENYTRRIRWLTGYSQCDKIYKERVREQAKRRGKLTSGEREYFFGIVPLLIFAVATIVTIIIGIGLSTYYAVMHIPAWFYSSWLLVFMPFWIMYSLLFLFGVLAMLSDREAFRALSAGERIGMLLYNPFYLLEYIPLFLNSRISVRRGKTPDWKETERMTYDDSVAERADFERDEERDEERGEERGENDRNKNSRKQNSRDEDDRDEA